MSSKFRAGRRIRRNFHPRETWTRARKTASKRFPVCTMISYKCTDKKILGLLAILIGSLTGSAQQKSQPNGTPASPTQAGPNSAVPELHLDGAAALQHLNQVINWYRHSTTLQSAGLPSDAVYQDNTKNLGGQVVQLAFRSAKAEAAIISAEQKANGNQPATESTQQQNLAQMQSKTSARIDDLQSQIEQLNTQLARTAAPRRLRLVSQRDALQSELELQKALLDAIQKMASFVETNGEIAG